MFNEPAVKTACIKRSKIGARESSGGWRCEMWTILLTHYVVLLFIRHHPTLSRGSLSWPARRLRLGPRTDLGCWEEVGEDLRTWGGRAERAEGRGSGECLKLHQDPVWRAGAGEACGETGPARRGLLTWYVPLPSLLRSPQPSLSPGQLPTRT